MKKNLFLLCLSVILSVSLSAQDVVTWKFSLADKGSGEIELVVKADIQSGWHLYDVTIPEGGPNPTELTIEEIKGAVKVGAFKSITKAHKSYDEVFSMEIGYFETTATFVQRFRVSDKAAFVLAGDVRGQACSDSNCTPPLPTDFRFSAADLPAGFKVAAATTEPVVKPQIEQSVQPTETPVEPVTDTLSAALAPATISAATDIWSPVIEQLKDFGAAGSTADMTLLWIFLFGFGGGFLALLTPCVWPMIPMTVSFFLKRNKSKSKAVREAVTYGLAIVVIYVALGLIVTAIFGASALNDMSTSAVFNLIFFALLVVFAISFFGAFDLVMPSSWTNKMDSKAESTSGVLSIFFMAFTLALVSFSCTGPVIGWLLVEAASSGAVVAPLVGMLGFAVALAIPFSLFAIFPSWLQSMPKSGGWLNSVKVVLGFLELALALKFLSVADLAYGWGILDREVFVSLWIVIFVMLGIYLLGKLKLPHDSDLKYVSVSRLFMAIISFSFALYMVPGLWGAPLKAISAFSPPLYTQDFKLYEGEVHAAFDDYDMGMEYAKRNNRPVMVDFSGYGCVNCRKMEASVWTDPRVKSILEKDYVLITLMVDDKTPLQQVIEVNENGRTTRLKTIGDKWSYLQRHKFGNNSQPCYVTLNHDGMPIGPSYAYDQDVDKYLKFLHGGLDKFKELQDK